MGWPWACFRGPHFAVTSSIRIVTVLGASFSYSCRIFFQCWRSTDVAYIVYSVLQPPRSVSNKGTFDLLDALVYCKLARFTELGLVFVDGVHRLHADCERWPVTLVSFKSMVYSSSTILMAMLTGLLSVLILGLLSKPTKARSAIILLSRSMLLPSTFRTRRRALRFASNIFR